MKHFIVAAALAVLPMTLTAQDFGKISFTLDKLIADGRSFCDGNFTFEDAAVERFDFNLDGEFDLAVLDEYGFSCEGSYCGTAGCTVHFITPVDYSSAYVRNWELVRTETDQPVIFLSLHGVSCGEVGITPCYGVISIFEGRFIARAR